MRVRDWKTLLTNMTLRTRLMVGYAAVLLVALAIAGYTAIGSFDSALTEQANRAIEANDSVANSLLDGMVVDVEAVVADAGKDPGLRVAAGKVGFDSELRARTQLDGLTYLIAVDGNGRVQASSTRSQPYDVRWTRLLDSIAGQKAASFIDVVPESELLALGLADELAIETIGTDGGAAVEGEESGALAIVAVTPLKTEQFTGMLVAVSSFKLNHALVDAIVSQVGGTSTVFQGGIRVSTTVTNAVGERAIGTVVSDPVRKATLVEGRPFRGQAFVVNQESLTAYDPIKNPDGDVVGMLFVGLPLQEYDAATSQFTRFYTLVIIGALVMGLVGAYYLARGVSRPIAELEAVALRVAGGDLTVRADASGFKESRALADSFNFMIEGLGGIIGTVDDASASLGSVSTQISAASRNSAEQASRQASSVAETTATVEELSRTFNAVAEGASRVLEIAEDSLEAAQEGQATVESGAHTMEDLTDGAREVQEAAAAMTGVAADITEMTIIIGGIAEQTKILAMNAAIEAARAGDAGKGFGVVATEIRTLADSVARSASHISQLVVGIQAASKALATTAEHQAELTAVGARQAGESNQTFGSLVGQMSSTAAAAREIAAAATQQKVAADQIVSAMQQVSNSSNESASAARQLADAATEVESEADRLKRGLGGFRIR